MFEDIFKFQTKESPGHVADVIFCCQPHVLLAVEIFVAFGLDMGDMDFDKGKGDCANVQAHKRRSCCEQELPLVIWTDNGGPFSQRHPGGDWPPLQFQFGKVSEQVLSSATTRLNQQLSAVRTLHTSSGQLTDNTLYGVGNSAAFQIKKLLGCDAPTYVLFATDGGFKPKYVHAYKRILDSAHVGDRGQLM